MEGLQVGPWGALLEAASDGSMPMPVVTKADGVAALAVIEGGEDRLTGHLIEGLLVSCLGGIAGLRKTRCYTGASLSCQPPDPPAL
jgi:hypothetical protein